MFMLVLRTLCIFIMLLSALGCTKAQKLTSLVPAAEGTGQASAIEASENNFQDKITLLQTKIILEKQEFKQREKINLKLTLSNPTKDTISVPFPMGGQWLPYFIIEDSKGNELWNSHYGKTFIAIFGTGSINAGEIWTHSEMWDGRDNNGNYLTPGQYTLKAVGCYFGQHESGDTLTISIQSAQ